MNCIWTQIFSSGIIFYWSTTCKTFKTFYWSLVGLIVLIKLSKLKENRPKFLIGDFLGEFCQNQHNLKRSKTENLHPKYRFFHLWDLFWLFFTKSPKHFKNLRNWMDFSEWAKFVLFFLRDLIFGSFFLQNHPKVKNVGPNHQNL